MGAHDDTSGRSETALIDPRHANLKPWKPGQSGNAAGTSKLSRELREYIAGPEGVNTKEDVDAIRDLARRARSEFVKLQARTWLAEQVVGKATQGLTLKDADGNEARVGIVILPATKGDGDGE